MRALLLTKTPGAASPALSFSASRPMPVPTPGHVLVRIHASAIQPSDIYNAAGGFGSTTFPRIPGRDFSGVVASSTSDDWSPGTEVFGTSGATQSITADGCHAEYAAVPAEGLAPKPAALSHVQAATVGVPWTTAALAVRSAGVSRGATVLVLGANGAVGSAACHLLRARGCAVLRGIRGRGGDLDTAAGTSLQTVRRLPGAEAGVDAVIDTVGAPALTRAAIDTALGHGGRLVFIAAPKGAAPPPELAFDMRDFYRREKSVVGVNSVAHSIGVMAERLREVLGLMGGRQWDELLKETSWDEVSLEDAVEAYRSRDKKRKHVIQMLA